MHLFSTAVHKKFTKATMFTISYEIFAENEFLELVKSSIMQDKSLSMYIKLLRVSLFGGIKYPITYTYFY